jgi:hypothetical protein
MPALRAWLQGLFDAMCGVLFCSGVANQ